MSTAASYECPTCKTRYTGPTAVALAVDRVDLEYDRSGSDSRHADVACANLVVVGLREGTTIDARIACVGSCARTRGGTASTACSPL